MASGTLPSSDVKIGSVSANGTATITFSNTQCCFIIGMRIGTNSVYFCKLFEVWNNSPLDIVSNLPTGFTITKSGNVITITNSASGVGSVPFVAIGASNISYS